MVDAKPARDHIIALREQSMGVRRIAELSGLSFPVVGGIMWGRAGRPAPARIMRRSSDAILSVRYSLDGLLPAAMIDATPYRRRLQALACLGWTWSGIAEECGVTFQQISAITRPTARSKVQATTARLIRDTYERLWDTPPTPRNGLQASRHELAKKRAHDEGWPPPLAWDDIDDLTEHPDTSRWIGADAA